MKNIAHLIVSENFSDARDAISETLNEMAANLIEALRIEIANELMAEDFNANKFEGKTDMDKVREKGGDNDGEEQDGGDNDKDDNDDDNDQKDSSQSGDDNEKEADSGSSEGDDKDSKGSLDGKKKKNITINIKE